MSVSVAPDRNSHWVKANHQTRMPKRWIAFDTESRAVITNDTEIQEWHTGAALRWRTDLKTGDHVEQRQFNSPGDLWGWVTDYCKPGTRTVVAAHNLGHDARIADVFNILPQLGWHLEWCNLDRNVSAMTWRSDHGTLVFMDTWTWLPMRLAEVADYLGLPKLAMPSVNAKKWQWEQYCMRDAELVYRAMSDLISYIRDNHLGNWQPTGAGMAYATWRHKYMTHKPLVHDDIDALTAERAAMHTGRAEAWRHGKLTGDRWTEIDMRNAYVTIAAECDLPCKLKFRTGAISCSQYAALSSRYRVLCLCDVTTTLPVVPYQDHSRQLWPIGTFRTWLWDTEVNQCLTDGCTVKIRDAYVYTRAPLLASWAQWVLSLLAPGNELVSPVVRTWAKHCGRALIGRISLRTPRWEQFGGNPDGMTGMSHMIDGDTGIEHRLMHVGDRTLIESERVEGRDSLPQVTGWIMAECRARLWRAMRLAGLANVAHVDTDSLLVNQAGLAALRAAEGASMRDRWQVKGTWRTLIVYGPRNYRAGALRKAAGVPRKATEVAPNEFTGERWHGLASDIEDGRCDRVTIEQGTWSLATTDPRRQDAIGGLTLTCAYEVGSAPVSSPSDSSRAGSGA